MNTTSQEVSKKTSRTKSTPPPAKKKTYPYSEESAVVAMMIGKMDDLSLVRSGAYILQDIGLDNPIRWWGNDDHLKVAGWIRSELLEEEGKLKEKYRRITDKVYKMGHVFKMFSNLTDAVIRCATMTAFMEQKDGV